MWPFTRPLTRQHANQVASDPVPRRAEMQAIGTYRLYRFESDRARAVCEALIPYVVDVRSLAIPDDFVAKPDAWGQLKVSLKHETWKQADEAFLAAAGDPGRPAEVALLRATQRQPKPIYLKSSLKVVRVYEYELDSTGDRARDVKILTKIAALPGVSMIEPDFRSEPYKFCLQFDGTGAMPADVDNVLVKGIVEEETEGEYTVLVNPRRM